MLNLKSCLRDIANAIKDLKVKTIPDILYTNPQPTSAFPATTLNIAWKSYSYIGIVFPETGEIKFPTNTSITTFTAKTMGGLGSSGGYTWNGTRSIILQSNGLHIDAMAIKYANSTSLTTSTGSLIPTIIYGYK